MKKLILFILLVIALAIASTNPMYAPVPPDDPREDRRW